MAFIEKRIHNAKNPHDIHDVSNVNFAKRFRVGRVVEKFKPQVNPKDRKFFKLEEVDFSEENINKCKLENTTPVEKAHREILNQKLVGYISNVNLSVNGNFTFTITWENNEKQTISWNDDISILDGIYFYEMFVKMDALNIINYITQFPIRKKLNRSESLPYRTELIPKKKKVIVTKRMKERKRQEKIDRRAERRANSQNQNQNDK